MRQIQKVKSKVLQMVYKPKMKTEKKDGGGFSDVEAFLEKKLNADKNKK